MLEMCEAEVKKVERELEQLEAEINPALDDNALVAFSYLLSKVIDEMKSVPEVNIFHKVKSEMADTVVACCSLGRFIILSLQRKFQTITRSSKNRWTCRQCRR